jgi:tetratricopeptide (TPR) repeat protein
MHLGRLDEGTVRKLVLGLAPGIDPALAAHIAERTAGIPLHAVEFVRMLLNAGRLIADGDGYRFDGDVDEMTIPDSVSAVIGARLDRLDADAVATIQDASVLGYSFALGDLALMRSQDPSTLERMLRELGRREILELDEDPRSPERGQYRFVQSLIREVAYGRLSRADRVSRHLQVARQFEASGDVEVAGIVASHYADAAASDPGDRELAVRARSAIIGAAERALSLHSHAQAIGLYERAIALTPDALANATLLLDIAHAHRDAGSTTDAIAVARDALHVFEEAGASQDVIVAKTAIASFLAGDFRADEAVELILPVYQSTPRSHDIVWARLATQTSRALMLANRARECVDVANDALPVMETLDLVEEVIETLINKGSALGKADQWLEGSVILRGVVEMSAKYDMTRASLRAINNIASVTQGDDRRDRSQFSEVERLVARLGDQAWLVRYHFMNALQQIDFGEYDAADASLDRAEELPLDANWIDYVAMERLRIASIRSSMSEASTASLLELVEPYVSATDPQLLSAMLLVKSNALFLAGRFEEVGPLVIDMSHAGDSYPNAFDQAVAAAAWIGDAAMLERVEDVVAAEFSHGRACTGLRLFVGALRSALSGEDDIASVLYTQASEIGRQVIAPLQLAILQAAFARVLGLDHPVGLEAGSDAGRFFDETGSRRYSELLADALPSGDAVPDSLAG